MIGACYLIALVFQHAGQGCHAGSANAYRWIWRRLSGSKLREDESMARGGFFGDLGKMEYPFGYMLMV